MLSGGVLFGVLLLGMSVQQVTGTVKPDSHQASPVPVPTGARAACDIADAIAAKTPGVTVRRNAGVFDDDAVEEPVVGCQLVLTGSFIRAGQGGDAATRLRQAFPARGWQEIPEYAADGKDGTRFAFRKADVACLFHGDWNGGADGEPEIPREDWYKVSVLCTSPVPPAANRH
jgi:hypothetical protein